MSGPIPPGPGGGDRPENGRPPLRPRQAEKRAPCTGGCPNGTDVRGWIGMVAQRVRYGVSEAEALREAWLRVAEVNPFPASLGRICPHPCQEACNRKEKDGAVEIHSLERFLGDWALDRSLSLPRLDASGGRGSVGVVGAGPAGLSCAYQLARRGHRVVVYERSSHPGGMLRYGIPDYRLPPRILDAEIRRILALGVELRTGFRVGREADVPSLRSTHRALFLGIGAQAGRPLGIPGEDGAGCWTGVDYLRRVNAGREVRTGSRVAVVGGGNSAVDAARTALRGEADEVILLYRRTRDEMPAIDAEIEEMLREGVTAEFLVAPLRVERSAGRITALVLQDMELGDEDASGRPRPIPVAGSHRRLPVDGVVAAVSQVPDWDDLEDLRPRRGWLHPGPVRALDPEIWAGGDVTGLGIASEAVAQGRRAARAIHAHLTATDIFVTVEAATERVAGPETIRPELYPSRAPVAPPSSSPGIAAGSPGAETVGTIEEEDFFREAERCFSCGLCFGCRHCWMFCMARGFSLRERPMPGAYFDLSLDICESCGKCVDVCPSGYLEFDDDGLEGVRSRTGEPASGEGWLL